ESTLADEGGDQPGFRLIPMGTRYLEDRLRYGLPTRELLMPAAIGFVLGALVLIWFTGATRSSLSISRLSRAASFLIRNPLSMVWMLLFAGVAYLVYAGFFDYLSEFGDLPAAFEPLQVSAGVTALLGMALDALRRIWKPAWLEKAQSVIKGGSGTLSGLVISAQHSAWFIALFQDNLEKAQQRRISDIAERYNLGLVQKAMCNTADRAVDRSAIDPTEHERFINDLMNLESGSEARTTFLNTRRAVQLSTSLLTVDQLTVHLGESDLRVADRRVASVTFPGEEQRVADRRSESSWSRGSTP
ncbi:MAG: hypothetical protein O7G86_02495, partial [Gammaproteobacteria bacterium]|nr:hypothetical protein [Gammaproteobacteria bacterium]